MRWITKILLFLSVVTSLNAQDATGYFQTIQPAPRLWKLSINYNTTPYSYLTTAPFSDTDTEGFNAGSNVIEVETIVTDDYLGSDNANTGLAYDFKNDLFLVKDWGPELVRFFDRSLTEVTTVNGHTVPVQVEGNQGIGYNHIDSTIYDFDLTTLKNFKLDGTLDDSQGSIAPSPYSSGGLSYNPFTGELFLSDDLPNPMRILRYQGGLWSDVSQTNFGVGEGIGYDYIKDKIATYLGGAIRLRDRTGHYNLQLPLPTPGSEAVTEGIVPDPRDGTFWFNADEHFHGGIVGGNRLWHTDPLTRYGKYILFPDMIRYHMFKLPERGELSGSYNYQKIYADDWVIGPVIDFESFTGQQDIDAWVTDDNVDFEFRGSGTAPSTTTTTGPPPHDLFFYDANQSNDGWGSTTPGSWQSTPTTNRYMQFRVKPLEPTAPFSGWTPASLGSKLKIWGTPRELTRVGKNAEDNDVEIIMNRGNTNCEDGALTQGTDAFKGTWTIEVNNEGFDDDLGYVRFTGNRHLIATGTTGGAVETQSTGEWNIFGKRVTANTRAIWFSEMQTTTTNNQFRIFSFPSGGGTANWIGYQIINGAGAVTLTCGITHATTAWEMLTFGADGTELYLYIDNVKQTLTCSTGAVTPASWYGTVAGDQVAIGLIDTSGSSVTGDTAIRDYIYTDPLTTQERTEYFNYGTALGYR